MIILDVGDRAVVVETPLVHRTGAIPAVVEVETDHQLDQPNIARAGVGVDGPADRLGKPVVQVDALPQFIAAGNGLLQQAGRILIAAERLHRLPADLAGVIGQQRIAELRGMLRESVLQPTEQCLAVFGGGGAPLVPSPGTPGEG